MKNAKLKAALVSNISNTFLVIGKLIIGFLSGSVSIISEAIHSGMDLMASMIAFLSIKKASNPADEKHRYGYGKFEDISGLLEGQLIFVAAGWIIYQAIHKMLYHRTEIEFLELGIIVMAGSSIINFFVSNYLYKISRKYDSIALEADALHLRTDVYTSVGIFVGLFLIKIFKLEILDPIIAIIVALFIIRTSMELVTRSFRNLTDFRLSDDDLSRIHKIINEHNSEFVDFHELRGRKAGSERHLDFHLTIKKDTNLEKAHSFCDHLEEDIKKEFPGTQIMIHLEPNKEDTE
ncbi:MAG: cation diffusion facilitator family transporter [bacterium]|nr:cation diffusion facilitator family transporter [bacterium]